MATPEQPSERKLRQNAGNSIVDGTLGIAPWNFEWSWQESADHVSSRARVMVIVVETVRLGDMQPLWMHPPTGLGFVSYSHPCKCLPKKFCHDSCNQVHQNFRTQPWSIARNCNRDAPQLFSERCSISTDFFSHVLRKDVCHQSHGLWQSLPTPTWVHGATLRCSRVALASISARTNGGGPHLLEKLTIYSSRFHEPTGRKVAPKNGKNYPDKAPVAAQAARSKALAAWKSFAATVISEVLESSASHFLTEPTGASWQIP